MRTTITREYEFPAAHWLPGVPEDHKCHRLHGHSYVCHVTVAGSVDGKTGWIADFAELDERVKPLVARLDHRTLNDIAGLENPTAELIAAWFFDRLQSDHLDYDVIAVRVFEERYCWAEVRADAIASQ